MVLFFLYGVILLVGIVFCKGSWFGGLALTLKWAGIALIVFIMIAIYQTSTYTPPAHVTYGPPADTITYAQPTYNQPAQTTYAPLTPAPAPQNQVDSAPKVAAAPVVPRRQFDGIYNPETQAPMNAPAQVQVAAPIAAQAPAPSGPSLGLSLRPSNASEQAHLASLGVPAGVGVVITDVSQNSRMYAWGVYCNDIIVAADGQWLTINNQLRAHEAQVGYGATVHLMAYRRTEDGRYVRFDWYPKTQ
ncbi:MAG: hypothetical protein ACRYFS_14045 [Janthinobacterium lividum]